MGPKPGEVSVLGRRASQIAALFAAPAGIVYKVAPGKCLRECHGAA